MTKIFKRITATGLAASMATLMTISASAASETKSFAARHYNFSGAPASLSYVGYADLIATAAPYTGTITYMSDITNRKLTIRIDESKNTNFVIDSLFPLTYNNTGARSWYISGSIFPNSRVYYEADAFTELRCELYVEGNISC